VVAVAVVLVLGLAAVLDAPGVEPDTVPFGGVVVPPVLAVAPVVDGVVAAPVPVAVVPTPVPVAVVPTPVPVAVVDVPALGVTGQRFVRVPVVLVPLVPVVGTVVVPAWFEPVCPTPVVVRVPETPVVVF